MRKLTIVLGFAVAAALALWLMWSSDGRTSAREERSFPDGFCVRQTPTARGTAPYVLVCAGVPTKGFRSHL